MVLDKPFDAPRILVISILRNKPNSFPAGFKSVSASKIGLMLSTNATSNAPTP